MWRAKGFLVGFGAGTIWALVLLLATQAFAVSPFTWNTAAPANSDIAANFPALNRADKSTLAAVLGTFSPSGTPTTGWREVQFNGNDSWLCQNATFTGTVWNRDDTTLPAQCISQELTTSGVGAAPSTQWYWSASGANPITWTTGSTLRSNALGGMLWLGQIPNPGVPVLTASATGGSLATGTYFVQITALDAIGGQTLGSTVASTTVTGPTGSIAVTWTAVNYPSTYSVFADTVNPPGKVTTGVTGTSFTVTAISATVGTAPTSNPTAWNFKVDTSATSGLAASLPVFIGQNPATGGIVNLPHDVGGIRFLDSGGFTRVVVDMQGSVAVLAQNLNATQIGGTGGVLALNQALTFPYVPYTQGTPTGTPQAIVGTVANVTGTALTPSTTGGSLASGTYNVQVTAVGNYTVSPGETAGPTVVSAVVTGPTGSIAIVWNQAPGAATYTVYADTANPPGHKTTGIAQCSAATCSFTLTAVSATVGTAPVSNTAQAYIYVPFEWNDAVKAWQVWSPASSAWVAPAQPTFTLKKGSGLGDYTTASATYVDVDATNLAYTVTIPIGQKVRVECGFSVSQNNAAGAVVNIALADGTTTLIETRAVFNALNQQAPGSTPPFDFVGDGLSHTFKLRWNASVSAGVMSNSSATLTPECAFYLGPAS